MPEITGETLLTKEIEMLEAKSLEQLGVEEKIEILCRTMTEETETCRKLIALTEEEQKFLVKDDVENLERNTEEIQVIVRTLRSCQDERRKLIKEIGEVLNLSEQELSVSKIADKVNGAISKKLLEKSKDLVKTGEKLYKVNRNTLYLVGFSLELLEQQSRLWAELLSDQEGYGEDGRMRENSASASLFVQEKV